MFTMINHETRNEISANTIEELRAHFEGAENCTTAEELANHIDNVLDTEATVYERTEEQLTPSKVEKIMTEKGWHKWPGGLWASTEEQAEGTKVIDIFIDAELNGKFIATRNGARITLASTLDLDQLMDFMA